MCPGRRLHSSVTTLGEEEGARGLAASKGSSTSGLGESGGVIRSTNLSGEPGTSIAKRAKAEDDLPAITGRP